MIQAAFQDLIGGNHCWGCGRANPQGLRIKSYWDGAETVCSWTPQPWHCASPTHVVNGGILGTLIDCHAIMSAMAGAARAAGHELGAASLWYVTGKLEVSYLAPTPLGPALELRARLEPQTPRKTLVHCTVAVDGKTCASGVVLAVQVPASWMGDEEIGNRR